MPRRTPLVRPRHFHPRGWLQLGPSGLRFSAKVHHRDREFECVVSGLDEPAIRDLLASSARREPASLVLNPRRPSLKAVVTHVGQDAAAAGRDGVSPMSGLQDLAIERWAFQARPGENYTVEGQSLLMVVVVDRRPVGFFSGSAELFVSDEEHFVDLIVAADMVYVSPRFRGQGYGMDLSVATGWLLGELLGAVYAATPSGSTLDVTLRADIYTTGGEHFANKLAECLEYEMDMLKEHGRRRTVRIGRFSFDGGW